MPVTWPDRAANQTYKTIEVATVKRLSNRWQLVASYSATKKDWPIGAAGLARGTGFGTSSPTFSAAGDNAGYPDAERRDQHVRRDLGVGCARCRARTSSRRRSWCPANFHHTSGDPFARQVRFTGGRPFRSSC